MPSAVKKLLAGLGIGAAAGATEEAEASPFFHASRKIFKKPQAVPETRAFGNVYGPGFYGLEEDMPNYFEMLKYGEKREYNAVTLQDVIEQFPALAEVPPGQLINLLPDQRRKMGNIRGTMEAMNLLGDDRGDFIQTLDDLVANNPFKSKTNLAEYDFDVAPGKLLDFDAPAEDYPDVVKELIGLSPRLESAKGMSIGDAITDPNMEQDVLDILLGKGWRGMRHTDDVTNTPGLTSFNPDEDLRFINRRYE